MGLFYVTVTELAVRYFKYEKELSGIQLHAVKIFALRW
jgi:hypothetical protein